MNKEESYDNNCLITNEPLEKIHITLNVSINLIINLDK